MIPDICSISTDRRMIPGQKEDDIIEQIDQELKKYQSKNPEVNVGMKKIRCTKPAITEPNELISKLALKIVSEELQKKIELGGFSACCDMTFLRNEGNMPVVILGPGDIGMAHKKDEYVDIESIYKAQRIYKNIAIEWLTRNSSK
jgi:acetylornithine deacetylase/succinyl-diaminopimelate desuccinylase-like protein